MDGLVANGGATLSSGELASRVALQGFVKTIFDAESGEFLGAHLAGPNVTELIHSFGLARVMEAAETAFLQTVFPHATLSEALQESVLDAFGRALHI
jgi:dihydrolipoamide dehydrogenase